MALLSAHRPHMIGACQRLHGPIRCLEQQTAFLIQIKHATKDLALRRLSTDLTMDEPAPLADLCDGFAVTIFQTLKIRVKAGQQTMSQRISVDLPQDRRGQFLQQ